MFYEIKKKIRSSCYDKIQEHSTGTPILYQKILTFISPESSILDVGIGNGICIEKNAQLIKEKKLLIKGIDIDEEYLDICKFRIKQNNLEKNVSCSILNLLTISESSEYDYIIYSGSYPVISDELMHLMLEQSKKLLKERNGKILFSHSLYTEDIKSSKLVIKILNIVKKNLRYIPFLWTDFGKMTSVIEFESLLHNHKLLIEKKVKMQLVSKSENRIKKIFLKFLGVAFKNEHYIYCVKIKE